MNAYLLALASLILIGGSLGDIYGERRVFEVELTLRWFVQGTLPAGEDIVLGLDDDAVGIAGISVAVPAEIRAKIARLAASFRRKEAATRNSAPMSTPPPLR